MTLGSSAQTATSLYPANGDISGSTGSPFSPVFNHGHRLVVSLSLNPLIPLRLLPLEQYSAIQQIKHGWTTLRLVCPHPLPDLPEDNIATPKGLVYKLRPS